MLENICIGQLFVGEQDFFYFTFVYKIVANSKAVVCFVFIFYML